MTQQTNSEHAGDGGTKILQNAQVWETQVYVQFTTCALVSSLKNSSAAFYFSPKYQR